MRIISGEFKSRKLFSPSGKEKVRPTTDRAKESLFNIITNFFDPEGTKIIDLFCGSGAIGLEFISRGAKRCVFVDYNVSTVRKNVDALGVGDRCLLVKDGVLDYIRYDIEADLIFADPPYDYKNYKELLELASVQNCYFILEHCGELEEGVEFQEKILKEKKIGVTCFTFFDFRIQTGM